MITKNKHAVILALIIFISLLFRFYKLDWGEGLFFHPDENNMAVSVGRMKPPDFHPRFFAYGHFPLNLAYLLIQIGNFIKGDFSLPAATMEQAVITLRSLAALASSLTVVTVYFIGSRLYSPTFGLIGAALVGFSPGLIQAAHFGTTESLLALFIFLVLFFSFQLMEDKNPVKNLAWLGLILGLGISTKINALLFFAWPLLAFLFRTNFSIKKIYRQINLLLFLLLAFFSAFAIAFLTSPYLFLDWQDFFGTAHYEIGIAQGKAAVFYTRQFIGTKPVLFQFQKIFPYSLNPFLTLTGSLGFILLVTRLAKKKPDKKKALLAIAFLSYFIPNALLFAKWTRFVLPVLPFFSLFSLELFVTKIKGLVKVARFSQIALVAISFIFALSFFNIYLRPDVRFTATDWMTKNILPGTPILNEPGNVVDLPLRGNFKTYSVDLYNLENEPDNFNKLLSYLEKSDYLLVPSRRIFTNHPHHLFPKTACYYQLLFSDQLGFKKIKEIYSYPSLGFGNWQLELKDENAEETWTVFDHPVIRIYQKIKPLSASDYRGLFNQCTNQQK